MHEVHYFQRFSRKEDVVTNNTLLLFKRLQHHSAQLFEDILCALVSPTKLIIGAVLSQQEGSASETVPDGVIRQQSFHILIETKLHATFSAGQLTGHLAAFKSSTAEVQLLLLLSPKEPAHLAAARNTVQIFNRKRDKSVHFASTTFSDIVKSCHEMIPEHERVMLEMVADFESFCEHEGLLSKSDADCLVVGCSSSLADNLQFCLYYDPKKSHRPAKYIGFYKDKAVQAIGTLEKVVRVDRTKGALLVHDGESLTSAEKQRINGAMDHAPAYGWNITHGHCFFLAGSIAPTLFRKQTKYPLWNRRYFDLREELKLDDKTPLPDLKSLAEQLRNRTW